MKKRRMLQTLLAALLAAGLLALPAGAALSTEYPEPAPEQVTVSTQEIELLEERLQKVRRVDAAQFEIVDAMTGTEEKRSTDYTVSSLNARRGVVTVSEKDVRLLDETLAAAGLADATDARKLAWAVEWLHNYLVYDGYHTGSYVYSAFEEAGGQCNIYNGAVCALAARLGYEVRLVRGYRASTGSSTAHWWGELICEDGTPLVLETGSREDGAWYFLGNTYEETHGHGRDYVKCGLYAHSGETQEYFGAAAYLWSAELAPETARLAGRVGKGADYTVTEVGLLLGEAGGEMQRVASDAVDATHNAANEGRGFSVSYDLATLGIPLAPGMGYDYAFYAVVDGVTCTGNTGSFAMPAAKSAPPPAPEQPAQKGQSVWLLVALSAGAGLVGLLALCFGTRRRKKSRAAHRRHKVDV